MPKHLYLNSSYKPLVRPIQLTSYPLVDQRNKSILSLRTTSPRMAEITLPPQLVNTPVTAK